jgi:hypothetical protein
MQYNSWILVSFILFFTTPVLVSANESLNSSPYPKCINGPYDNNTALIDSIEASKWQPLRAAYLTAKPKTPCPESETDTNKKQFPQLNKIATAVKNQLFPMEPAAKITNECIAASLKRNPGQTGYTCNSAISPNKASNANIQCVTKDTVDYIHFAVNSAIQCMSSEDPIDSRIIFKKLNNETGFNPSLAWKGGAGLGQMTNIARREISIGKGRPLLYEIANSSKAECAGFKDIARNDLANSPAIRPANYCAWVSPSDGLARSLIYSIGYYLTMRDQYIKPEIEKRSPSLLKVKELISDLTAISYGAEGLDHAKWLLQKFRVNYTTIASELEAKIRTNSAYLKSIAHKMEEMTCLKMGLKPTNNKCNYLPTPNELEANTCVSK